MMNNPKDPKTPPRPEPEPTRDPGRNPRNDPADRPPGRPFPAESEPLDTPERKQQREDEQRKIWEQQEREREERERREPGAWPVKAPRPGEETEEFPVGVPDRESTK